MYYIHTTKGKVKAIGQMALDHALQENKGIITHIERVR